jgi:competence protein ComEA
MSKGKRIFFWLVLFDLILLTTFILERTGLTLSSVDVSPMSSVTVYVSGAIAYPGVYSFLSETNIASVIRSAGGLTQDADLIYVEEVLNLAQKVSNEQHLHIPLAIENTSNSSRLVSINESTLSELVTLPGVGDSTAQKIIAGRPFKDLSQLLDIPGIGEGKYAELLPLVRL